MHRFCQARTYAREGRPDKSRGLERAARKTLPPISVCTRGLRCLTSDEDVQGQLKRLVSAHRKMTDRVYSMAGSDWRVGKGLFSTDGGAAVIFLNRLDSTATTCENWIFKATITIVMHHHDDYHHNRIASCITIVKNYSFLPSMSPEVIMMYHDDTSKRPMYHDDTS